MSEQAVLWIFGILIGALFALVGAIAKAMWAKIAAIDSGDLAAFRAMDTERQKQMEYWRAVVDKRLDEKKASLKDHEHRLTRIERNGAPH